MKIIIVTGIDTEVGKTEVAGHLLVELLRQQQKVASFKPLQTGADGFSPDLVRHQQIIDELVTDAELRNNFLGYPQMCSYILPMPASPHLAAQAAKVDISMAKIIDDLHVFVNKRFAQDPVNKQFSTEYHRLDTLVVELAGGVMSPITNHWTNLDLISFFRAYAQQNSLDFEVVLVASGALGKLSQTLAAIEVLPQVDYLYWNTHLVPDVADYGNDLKLASTIAQDNWQYLVDYQNFQNLVTERVSQTLPSSQTHTSTTSRISVADSKTKMSNETNGTSACCSAKALDTSALTTATFNAEHFLRTNGLLFGGNLRHASAANWQALQLVRFVKAGSVELIEKDA